MECTICHSKQGTRQNVRERMFGIGDEFSYFECAGCGCLRLLDVPEDMSRYYPAATYYSFGPIEEKSTKQSIAGWFSQQRNQAAIFKSAGIGALLATIRPGCNLNKFNDLFGDAPTRSLDARILDVGCGSGALLEQLSGMGFKNLVGIDPFLPASSRPSPSVTIHAHSLDYLEGNGEKFDVIMFSHSFEHIENQVATLSTVNHLLKIGGVCKIEVPVAQCHASKIYGVDWVEWDAPRHIWLHTARSMSLLAPQAGLEVYRAQHVGTALEFWGSELYQRNLTLFDYESNSARDPHSVFSEDEMLHFASLSLSTNSNGTGGRILFSLRKAS